MNKMNRKYNLCPILLPFSNSVRRKYIPRSCVRVLNWSPRKTNFVNNWKSTLLPYVTLPTIRKVTRYTRNVTACEPQRERKSRNAAATDSNRTSTSYDPSPPFFRRFPRKPELFIFFFFLPAREKKGFPIPRLVVDVDYVWQLPHTLFYIFLFFPAIQPHHSSNPRSIFFSSVGFRISFSTFF